MKFKYFQQPFSFNLNGRSHVIFSLGFWVEKNLNSWRSRMKNKSLGKSFYSLSFNFQKFRIPSLSVNQSNNQSNLSIYYNIPKFRILGCYKPTTLKMNLVLEIRRGQQEIGQGLGSPQNPSIISGVWGATTLRNIVTVPPKLVYSILIVDSVGLLRS